MKTAQCPYCKEDIKADAIICKHCHERLYWSREEVVMTAISERIRIATDALIAIPISERIRIAAGALIAKPISVSACGALCHARFAGDRVGLNECFDDCEAISVIAAIAEKLQGELIATFADIVWEGRDIDPRDIDPAEFEKSVRERFSRLDKP